MSGDLSWLRVAFTLGCFFPESLAHLVERECCFRAWEWYSTCYGSGLEWHCFCTLFEIPVMFGFYRRALCFHFLVLYLSPFFCHLHVTCVSSCLASVLMPSCVLWFRTKSHHCLEYGQLFRKIHESNTWKFYALVSCIHLIYLHLTHGALPIKCGSSLLPVIHAE